MNHRHRPGAPAVDVDDVEHADTVGNTDNIENTDNVESTGTVEHNPYLWDGSGDVDPFVADLEQALAPIAATPAMLGPPPPLRPSFTAHRTGSWLPTLTAVSAAVGALALFVSLSTAPTGASAGPPVAPVSFSGLAVVDGARRDQGLLPDGADLLAVAPVTLALGPHGTAVVQEGSVVVVDSNTAGGQALTLRRGTLSAEVNAPPRFFTVHTPSTSAVDLGCAYDLHVDDGGDTHLRVTSGIVALEGDRFETLVPEGAEATVRQGAEPAVPFAVKTPAAFIALVQEASTAPGAERATAVVAAARLEDAVTLWHLVDRAEGEARAIYAAGLATLLASSTITATTLQTPTGHDDALPAVRAALLVPEYR